MQNRLVLQNTKYKTSSGLLFSNSSVICIVEYFNVIILFDWKMNTIFCYLFKYLKILFTAFQWILLIFSKYWLALFIANVIFDLVPIEKYIKLLTSCRYENSDFFLYPLLCTFTHSWCFWICWNYFTVLVFSIWNHYKIFL